MKPRTFLIFGLALAALGVGAVPPSGYGPLIRVKATVPDAPTGAAATYASYTSATVTFAAPSNNGGSAITNYTVTSSPGSLTASGNSLSLVVTGLTGNTAYTFTVKATNAIGNSVASSASASKTAINDHTGGSVISTSGDYKVVSFTASGTFNLTNTANCDYTLIATNAVAGQSNSGGNGGDGGRGAAGADFASSSISSGNHTVTLGTPTTFNNQSTFGTTGSGAGGFGGVNSDGADGNGGVVSTPLGTNVCYGGGGGGGQDGTDYNGGGGLGGEGAGGKGSSDGTGQSGGAGTSYGGGGGGGGGSNGGTASGGAASTAGAVIIKYRFQS